MVVLLVRDGIAGTEGLKAAIVRPRCFLMCISAPDGWGSQGSGWEEVGKGVHGKFPSRREVRTPERGRKGDTGVQDRHLGL